MLMEESVRFALENISEIVLFFDLNGKITYANKLAQKALEYEDIVKDCRIVDIFPTEFGISEGRLDRNIDFSEEMIQTNAYRKNRTCFPMSVRFTRDPGGNYIAMGYDASQETFLTKKIEQVRQEAEAALKVKSEFVANVTHELRTPVNGILGNTRELVEREEDREKKKLLALIERGCADMNAIINNILDFSKLEAGKFTLEPREFEFREMIDYISANHKNKIHEKGLDFIITIADDIPQRVIGDELRIVQILNNLLSNASKFTSVGRIVLEVVKTAQIENRVELFFLVIDTGIGIDKEGQEKLFKSFSQVDASISRRYGGTGLGLNICKQLVELMDGSIHVESEAGKGSMFSFHIWVEIPQDEIQDAAIQMPVSQNVGPLHLSNSEENQKVWIYGTEENLDEIKRKMSKLILSVEMDNWEKAELFMDTLRKLTENAPQEIKSAALRLKMAVQKEDYDKTTVAFEKLQLLL